MVVLAALLGALFFVAGFALNLFMWVLIVDAALSWLIAFDVVNSRSRLVQALGSFTYRVTAPVLNPIRKRLPAMGGVDLSPVILILGILFLQSFLGHLGASL